MQTLWIQRAAVDALSPHGSIFIYCCCCKSLQSCPTLCDPIDGSPPGSPVPGILQARTLEWVAILGLVVKNPPENARDAGLIPGSGRSPGGGNDNPLQYSCLGNPMDGGTWWAAVHGVVKSRTQLRDFTFTFHFHALEKAMAPHSSTLAWKIPWTEESGGPQSMGSLRVGHD